MDSFTHGYIACALWSSTDESGNPLDASYTSDDLAPDCLSEMIRECADFKSANASDVALWDATFGRGETAGHDFWLNRNGHGAGFWDRFSPSQEELYAAGQRLSEASKVYGSVDLYVGDDGRIYA